MRRLFWPCVVFLLLFSTLTVLSFGNSHWIFDGESRWLSLRDGRLEYCHARIERPEAHPGEESPFGGLAAVSKFSMRGFPSGPDWSFDWYDDETLFVPKKNQPSVNGGAISAMKVARTGIAAPLAYALAAWVMLSILPVRAWTVHRRRTVHGLCLGCGYDLHGIEESSPCPECGDVRTARPAP